MLTEERYNDMLSDFVEKLALFGSGYVLSQDTRNAINAMTYADHTGGAPLDVLHAPVGIDDLIPRTSEGIAISPVSFADEEKTTMSEIKTTLSSLTTAFETLLLNGLSVKMNGREFGRMVRTVME